MAENGSRSSEIQFESQSGQDSADARCDDRGMLHMMDRAAWVGNELVSDDSVDTSLHSRTRSRRWLIEVESRRCAISASRGREYNDRLTRSASCNLIEFKRRLLGLE